MPYNFPCVLSIRMERTLPVPQPEYYLKLKMEVSEKAPWFMNAPATMEIKRRKRVLGYFCNVNPEGYIVVSLHKALAPVKLYSATGNPHPESEDGIIGFIKTEMEQTLNAIEKELGPITFVRTEDVERILKISQHRSWNELKGDVQSFNIDIESGATVMEYEPGTLLLSTIWNQVWPYNAECPDLGCDHNSLNSRAWAGCTAIAATQVMRYWSWPPQYDWLDMPDSLTNSPSNDEIDAVATFIHDVGVAVGMIYGCDGSWIFPNSPMASALANNFLYNAGHELGFVHDMSSWHDFQKTELNAYRPLLYGNGGMEHTYVVDGWKKIYNLYWHINMGWGGNQNGWYTRNYVPLTDDMVRDITPIQSVDPLLIYGDYNRLPFPYRYFPVDCNGATYATFGEGQNLQFLPGVKLKCQAGYIRFESKNFMKTRLYSIKMTQSAGIEINNGTIKIHPGGGLTFLSRQEFSD